ncbi:MAG: septum formation initiator family protein [Kiritimatiellae bacterium]|nr:septum formation initiator family protein [Kiritimatiellia bacterium]
MDKWRDRLFKLFFFAAFLAIVVTGAMYSYPKYRRAQALRAEHARILRQIDEKKAEIAAIREKQRRFNTDREFVESLARQNRRVYPGELVFIFDE